MAYFPRDQGLENPLLNQNHISPGSDFLWSITLCGMLISSPSPPERRFAEKAYTLVELLAFIFIISSAAVVFEPVRGKHGPVAAVFASVLAVVVSTLPVILFYRWIWSRDEQRLTLLREQYRTIYRVKELTSDPKSVVKPEGAEIQIGDYGWDASPNRKDGLIHLQGLTARWQVVWHAGFRPDQIEKVATKPVSQYDYWAPDWAKPPSPPPCPFPVRERDTPTMGLPHHSDHYFENHPTQYYQSPTDAPQSG